MDDALGFVDKCRGQQRGDSQIYQRGVLPADIASERPWCSKLRHRYEVNENDSDECRAIVSFRKVDNIDADGPSINLIAGDTIGYGR